jgi:hypothetical protein
LISLKTKPIKFSYRVFFSFYFVFIVNFKSTQWYCCKIYLLNVIKKTMLARASCVGAPHAIHKVHAKSSSYRTLLFRKVFERSWHSLPDKVTRVLSFTAVWRWRSYLFHPSSISFQLNFHANPLKIKKRAFNLLVLQIWYIFFLLWFFYF